MDNLDTSTKDIGASKFLTNLVFNNFGYTEKSLVEVKLELTRTQKREIILQEIIILFQTLRNATTQHYYLELYHQSPICKQ